MNSDGKCCAVTIAVGGRQASIIGVFQDLLAVHQDSDTFVFNSTDDCVVAADLEHGATSGSSIASRIFSVKSDKTCIVLAKLHDEIPALSNQVDSKPGPRICIRRGDDLHRVFIGDHITKIEYGVFRWGVTAIPPADVEGFENQWTLTWL